MTIEPKSSRREISSFWTRVQRFERENIEASKIILSRAGEFGGEAAGLVRWARLTLRRRGVERRAA
jgi:hypothetical protein